VKKACDLANRRLHCVCNRHFQIKSPCTSPHSEADYKPKR